MKKQREKRVLRSVELGVRVQEVEVVPSEAWWWNDWPT